MMMMNKNVIKRIALILETYQELVPNVILGPHHLWVLTGLCVDLRRGMVVGKVREICLQPMLLRHDLLGEEILFIEEQNHRNGPQPPGVSKRNKER